MKKIHTDPANWGKIVKKDMAGFLVPPTHPEHEYCIMSLDGKYAMSLSSSTSYKWIANEIKEEAKALLQAWEPPSIDDEIIRNWIYLVLGHFEGCYSMNGGYNQKMDIVRSEKDLGSNNLFGVACIRKYFPSYSPTDDDLWHAYWGWNRTAGQTAAAV